MIDINEKEVAAALTDLEADPQPIHLEIGVTEAWSLMSTVQLASRYPINSKSVEIAAQVMQRHENALAQGNKLLEEVIKAGWENRLPNVPQESAIAAMQSLKNDIVLEMSKIEVYTLICSIQLAHRHPEYLDSAFAPVTGLVARQLQQAIAPSGILATLLDAGWDENMDIKI